MSINGVSNAGYPLGPGQLTTRDGIARQTQPSVGSPQSQPATTPGTAAAASARTPQALPATAPPGTDPALWSVLSSDERAHFAKLGAMGPLTYGRMLTDMRSAQLPSSRGGRLDVKV